MFEDFYINLENDILVNWKEIFQYKAIIQFWYYLLSKTFLLERVCQLRYSLRNGENGYVIAVAAK